MILEQSRQGIFSYFLEELLGPKMASLSVWDLEHSHHAILITFLMSVDPQKMSQNYSHFLALRKSVSHELS